MKKQDITRRELLRVLAAAGTGITAAAFLPARWVKPVVGSGVLPVHAQASEPPPPLPTTGSISGTVRSGNFLISTEVYLYAGGTASLPLKTGLKVARPKPRNLLGSSEPLDSTRSDSAGQYAFEGLEPGLYDLQCPFSFQTKVNQVVAAGNNTVVNFVTGGG